MAWPHSPSDDEGIETYAPDLADPSKFVAAGKIYPTARRCEWCGVANTQDICKQCGGPRHERETTAIYHRGEWQRRGSINAAFANRRNVV